MTAHFFTLFTTVLFFSQSNQTGINTKRIFINEFYGVGGKPFIELARKTQSKLSTNLYLIQLKYQMIWILSIGKSVLEIDQ